MSENLNQNLTNNEINNVKKEDKIVFFPLKVFHNSNEKIKLLAKTIPKYISIILEQFDLFEIFYVYFLNKNEIQNSKNILILPDNLDDEKFILEYLDKLNLKYKLALYGNIHETTDQKLEINLKIVSNIKNISNGLIYNNTFSKDNIGNIILELISKILNLLYDTNIQTQSLSELNIDLNLIPKLSYEMFYKFLLVIDEMTIRNPYEPIDESIINNVIDVLRYNPEFQYVIDLTAYICDDFLRFNMINKAIEVCDNAIKISPVAYKLYLTKAKLQLQANDYENAFLTLHQCLEINPNIGDVAYNFGKLALSMQKFEDAKKAFNKMIECSYEVALAYDNLGVIYASENQLEHAISLWHKAIEFDPLKVSAYTNLARAYIELNELKKAENYLQKAKLINPSYFMIYLNYYVLYKKLGNLKLADENYALAVKYNPDLAITDDIKLKLRKMISFIDSGYETDAIKIANEIFSVTDKCWQAYFLCGIAYRKLNDFNESESNFLKSIEINSNFADAYNELGILYLSNNKINEAFNCFNKALELIPDNPMYLCNLSLCLIEIKEYEKAKSILNKAKFLSPKDSKIDNFFNYLSQKEKNENSNDKKSENMLQSFIKKIKNFFKK